MSFLRARTRLAQPFRFRLSRKVSQTTRLHFYLLISIFVSSVSAGVCGENDCRREVNCSWPVEKANHCEFLPHQAGCDSEQRTATSDVEGGFLQKVHVYSTRNPNIIWRGMVLIDPGNDGPNLIAEEVMRYVSEKPMGPGTTIKVFDGEERTLGGEVSLWFSGPGPTSRYYQAKFRHVPHIIDGIDMVLNHDFYLATFPEKVPGMLMIRSKRKETQDQRRQREEAERRGNENARQQEAQRREERRAAEQARLAQQGFYTSNGNSGGYGGASR